MDVFDELVDSEVGIVIPHVKSLVEFCLHIAVNKELSDSSRVKALHFVGWLVRVKSKLILKNKLLSPILSVVFPIMATRGEEDVGDGESEPDDDEERLDEVEDSRPNAVATQVRKSQMNFLFTLLFLKVLRSVRGKVRSCKLPEEIIFNHICRENCN